MALSYYIAQTKSIADDDLQHTMADIAHNIAKDVLERRQEARRLSELRGYEAGLH